MVKSLVIYVVAAAFVSTVGTVLLVISMATEHWLEADGWFQKASNEKDSYVRYGLFSGILARELGGRVVFEIDMTCSVGDNVCAFLCKGKAEERKQELLSLYRGEGVNFDSTCNILSAGYQILNYDVSVTRDFRNSGYKGFINAGLYISTLTFLSIGVLFSFLSTIVCFINIFWNPIEVYLSFMGVYVTSAVSCFGSALTLTLWGALYGSSLANNAGILYTIKDEMATKGQLGYSYWILIPASALQLTTIILLFIRQVMLNAEPKPKLYVSASGADTGEIINF